MKGQVWVILVVFDFITNPAFIGPACLWTIRLHYAPKPSDFSEVKGVDASCDSKAACCRSEEFPIISQIYID